MFRSGKGRVRGAHLQGMCRNMALLQFAVVLQPFHSVLQAATSIQCTQQSSDVAK